MNKNKLPRAVKEKILGDEWTATLYSDGSLTIRDEYTEVCLEKENVKVLLDFLEKEVK